MFKLIVLVSCVAAPFAVVNGQSTWSEPGMSDVLEVRVAHSFFSDDDTRLTSVAVTPAVRFGVGSGVSIEAELPFVTAGFDDPSPFQDGTISGSRLGNPYLGISTMVADQVRFRAGFRYGVPGQLDEGKALALAYGVISEYDRFEAYLPETHSVRAMGEVGLIPVRGGFLQGRFGMTRVMSDGLEGEMMAEYGVRVGHSGGAVMVYGGVLGRYWLGGNDSGDANTNQVSVGVAANSGTIRPVVELRSFVDEEVRTGIKAVLSLGLAAEI